MPEEMEIVLGAEVEDIPRAVEFIGRAMAAFGISQDKALGAELAAEEACTNVVRHAYRGGQGYMKITCRSNGGSVEITLEDAGAPFDPTKRPEPDLTENVDKRPIGGLGIYLIRSFMDGLRYELKDGKNNLIMVLNRG